MDDNRLPKNNLNYIFEGRRNIGRPPTRWDDFREEQAKGPQPCS